LKFWCPNYAQYSTGDRWYVPGSGNPTTTLYFWQGHEGRDNSVIHVKAKPSGGCFYGGYHHQKLTGINVWYPGDKSVEDLLPKPGWDFGMSNSSLCYHSGMFCYVYINTTQSYWGQPAHNIFDMWYNITYEETTGALKGVHYYAAEYGADATYAEDWPMLKERLFNMIDSGYDDGGGVQHVGWSSPLGVEEPNGKLPPHVDLKFGEISGITTYGSPSSSVLRHTVEEAFVNAASGAPRANSNNLQNLKELISFGKAFLNGDLSHVLDDFNDFLYDLRHSKNLKRFMRKYKVKKPYRYLKDLRKGLLNASSKAIKDAWLAYRYAYSTSSMDADEMASYIDYLTSAIDAPYHKLYGFASDSYDGVAYTVTFKTTIHSLNFRSTESYLLEYGLLPTPYVVWDSIPFSFVIDWFLPIGDILESIDNIDYLNSAFELKNQTASVTYSFDAGDMKVHCYSRWLTAITTADASALARFSQPVRIKRIADALCLI
jgi:hypothetical protein